MADNHHGRPYDNDRDIYSSSSRRKQQRNSQRPPRPNPNYINGNRSNPKGQAHRPPRNANNGSPQNRKRDVNRTDEQELDRYNYVNRDVYSSSRKAKKNGGGNNLPPKKKKSKAKKIIIAVVCVILAIIIAIISFVAIMLSRINYKKVDTSSYVEQPIDAPTWDVISDNAITNILLLGVDRSEDGTARRSDTMMLMSIDSKTKNIRMVSFLRDLYVSVPTIGKTKINAAYAEGGAGLIMQTIENNFRVNIDHYIEIDFENFTKLIDAMDGIEIEMTQEEVNYMSNWYLGEYGSPISLQVGMNHMDGKAALTFARIRKLDSDFGRTGRQRQVMMSIFDKFKSLNPAQMVSVFYSYAQYITTDLSSGDILSLATQASTILGYGVKTSHVPMEGLYTEQNYNLIPDLPATCANLREFLYGKDTESTTTNNKKAN